MHKKKAHIKEKHKEHEMHHEKHDGKHHKDGKMGVKAKVGKK